MGTETYAQVAIEGRNFDQVLNNQDTNRPFKVVGNIDDADLVSLVRFLRSVASAASLASVQPWPINTVDAREDLVVVWLSDKPYSAQRVQLRKQGQMWVIVSAGVGVA